MDRFVIKNERLDLKDVLDFFVLTTNDFPDFKEYNFLENRAKKISDLADFVTCRTLTGKLIGMIAFYMNRPPLCYITHVSLLAYIIHSGFISGYQNRYGDNLKPPTNVYHRMTA